MKRPLPLLLSVLTPVLALVMALSSAALAPPAHAASTLAVAVTSEAVEEVGFVVTATGSTDVRYADVWGTVKPVGSAGCGPTFASDAGGSTTFFSDAAVGAFTVQDTLEVAEPGAYLLCAWLQVNSSDGQALAATSTEVTVRGAVASVGVRGKRKVRKGRDARIDFRGSSELSRYVLATVKRKGPRSRCASAYDLDSGDSFAYLTGVQGTFNRSDVVQDGSIDRVGRWLVCAWVQEGSSDLAPEAAGSFVFKVVRPKKRRR